MVLGGVGGGVISQVRKPQASATHINRARARARARASSMLASTPNAICGSPARKKVHLRV